MLDAHPELAIPPETHFLPAAIRAAGEAAEPSERFLRTVLSSSRWQDLGLDADLFEQRVRESTHFELGPAIRQLYAMYAKRFGKARWGDKTPQYVSAMTEVASVLPEARFVHLIRDGREVARSVMDLSWGPSDAASAARLWAEVISTGRVQAKALPGRYLEARYERLVADPEQVLQEICEFIELRFDPAMLRYHQRAHERVAELSHDLRGFDGRVTISASERLAMHARTMEPPRLVEKSLTGDELCDFESAAGDLLEALGYRLRTRGSSSA
jgi:hypothetical protein